MECLKGQDQANQIKGVGVSPGIAIGRVVLLDKEVNWPRRDLGQDEIELEHQRFVRAVNGVESRLEAVRDQLDSDIAEYAALIDSHILMLRDTMLFNKTLALIEEEMINAEWALDKVLEKVEARFATVTDDYLRERFQDVRQVAERIMRDLAGQCSRQADFSEDVILVTRDLSPEDILRMRSPKVRGFLAEMGGETSHSAIIARALRIPAVVGLKKVASRFKGGELALLDGSAGLVCLDPSPHDVDYYRQKQLRFKQYNKEVAAFAHLPPETVDGLRVKVEANIEMVDEVDQVHEYGAGGIGLFRSEYLYLGRDILPDEDYLYDVYRRILTRMAPLPVTIRTLDAGGDKIGSWQAGDEANPALGLRAIRYSLSEPDLFAVQLRALLRASRHGRLRIMFPMISSSCELDRVIEILNEVKKDLYLQGVNFDPEVEIGIMVEVPSAVTMADVLARQVDFFSIGTNDLIQYALAIDRVNEHVSHMYEPLHPAVIRLISQVVEAGHLAGIEVTLCGEMAGDPTCLPLLLGLGVDVVSMHPRAIPLIKKIIRSTVAAEVELLLPDLLSCVSGKEVRSRLSEFIQNNYRDDFPGVSEQ